MSESAADSARVPKRSKTPKAIIYLWCLIPLGFIGAMITLGLIIWIYLSISEANQEAERIDGKILSSMSAILLIAEQVEIDFREVLDGEPGYAQGDDTIELLESEIEVLQIIVNESLDHEHHDLDIDTNDLTRLCNASTGWRAENDKLLSQQSEAWRETQAAIEQLRSQMDSMLGRRRIQSILVAKKLREGVSDSQEVLIDSFLEESKLGSVLSMSNTVLSDLEIECNVLVHEPDIHLNESTLKNEIIPRLDLLYQQITELEDPKLLESFESIRVAILGTDHIKDELLLDRNATHAQQGLYHATQAHLMSAEIGDQLRAEVLSAMHTTKLHIDQHVESANVLRSLFMEVASKSLRMGGMTVILTGFVIGVVYGLLVYKISYSVQSFVRDLRDSHEALKSANAQTLQANEDLEDSICERERLQGQLLEAQKLESIGQLAAGIAHEINTPAQYVGDNTRFLRDEFEGIVKLLDQYAAQLDANSVPLSWEERNQQTREMLDEIDYEFIREEIPQAIAQSLSGIERVTHIVKAMKDFSHPGSANKEPADINNAIKSTALVCSNRWKYAADIEYQLDENLGAVPCLLGELNQVILNIIVNAADAIESFRGDSGEKGLIRVSTRMLDDVVHISVEDNGGGMPESVRAKVFDPFYTTKAVGKGTGQGLAISHDVIVNKHGGKISCDTQDGVGTTFMIELTMSESHEEDAESPRSAA